MAQSKKPGGDRASSKPSFQDQYKIIQRQLRSVIRQVWSRYSPERAETLYKAKRVKKQTNKDGSISKRPKIVFLCAECCGEFSAIEVQVDHIEPVGATPSFPMTLKNMQHWYEWFGRIFCDSDNLQVLCKECHKVKTKTERRKNV